MSWFNKEHTFTPKGVIWAILELTIRFAIAFFGVGFARYLTTPGQPPLTTSNLTAFSAVAGVLVILDYLKDASKNRKQQKKIKDDEIIFSVIGGAIERLVEDKENAEHNDQHYFSDLLHRLERITTAVLYDPNIQDARVSANLMVTVGEPATSLKLKYWGTRLEGRENIELPLNSHPPIPGAPGAYLSKKPIYIQDTQIPEYKSFFENKDYRSILSIPITKPNKEVCAIVNIDSRKERFFKDEEFIRTNLLPRLKPLTYLIALECELMD